MNVSTLKGYHPGIDDIITFCIEIGTSHYPSPFWGGNFS
jgi:hypothetical protein